MIIVNSIFKHKWLDYGFIFLFACLSLIWFREGNLINNVDIAWPFEPERSFVERFHLFQEQRGGGGFYGTLIAGAPFAAMIYFFSGFGTGIIVTQKLVFVFINFIVGVVVYKYVYMLWERKYPKNLRFIAILASYYAMYNLFFAFTWVRLQLNIFSLCWIISSLVIAMIASEKVEILDKTKKNQSVRNWILVCFFFGWTNGVQIPIFYIWVITFSLIFIIRIFSGHLEFRVAVKKYSSFMSIFMLTNLWWIIPTVFYVQTNGLFSPSKLNKTYDTENLAKFVSEQTSLYNVSRGLGDFAWFSGYWPQVDQLLRGSFWVFSLAGITIMIFLTFRHTILNHMPDKNVIIIFLIYFGALILSTGFHRPFTLLYSTLFDLVPGFSLQRAPWQKFGFFVLFGQLLFLPPIYNYMSHLFGYWTKQPNQINKNLMIKVSVILMLIPSTLLTLQGKMFSLGYGDRGWHETHNFGFHLEYPRYIFSLSEYINDYHKMNNILLLPDSGSNAYNWGFGGPADITWQLFDAGLISLNYGEGLLSSAFREEDVTGIYKSMYEQDEMSLTNQLKDNNISAILLREDFAYQFINNPYFEKIDPNYEKSNLYYKEILDNNRQIFSSTKKFGNWTLYEIKKEYTKENIVLRNAVQSISFKEVYNIDKFSPSLRYITWEGLNRNNQPLVLELSELKDNGWIAVSNSGKLLSSRESHFQVPLIKELILVTRIMIEQNFNQRFKQLIRFSDERGQSYKNNLFLIGETGNSKQYVLIYLPTYVSQFVSVFSVFITVILLYRRKREHKKT